MKLYYDVNIVRGTAFSCNIDVKRETDLKGSKMKKFMSFIVLIGVLLGGLFVVNIPASAQVYPNSNPTYIPNARMVAITVASGVPGTKQLMNSIGTMSLQLTGTCTNLVGRLEASNDSINWVTMNLYPHNATAAASAVTSATTAGLWIANSAGVNQVRMNNSGVTGTACVAAMSGMARDFTLPR